MGAGASVKLAINLPLAVYWQALGEAMILCQGLGVDEAGYGPNLGPLVVAATVWASDGRATASEPDSPDLYDLLADVTPGSPSEIRFTADVPGVFEVELEDSGTFLFEIAVR